MVVRKLTDPEIDEVSLVDKGANLRKFIFVKHQKGTKSETDKNYNFNKIDTNIKVESNGTVEGTTIEINGKKINPIGFHFSFYNNDEYDSFDNDVYCDYSLEEKGEKGDFSTIKLYRLQKAALPEADIKKMESIKESASLIQDYLKEGELAHLGEDEVVGLAKSLDVLADYKDLVPPEASEAIDYLISIAVKKNEEQVEINKNEKEEEMTEEKKKTETTEEKSETAESKEETKENKETGKEVPASEKTKVVVVDKEELLTLAASIKEVTATMNERFSAIEEKLKDEGDEEVDFTLDDVMAIVTEQINS